MCLHQPRKSCRWRAAISTFSNDARKFVVVTELEVGVDTELRFLLARGGSVTAYMNDGGVGIPGSTRWTKMALSFDKTSQSPKEIWPQPCLIGKLRGGV